MLSHAIRRFTEDFVSHSCNIFLLSSFLSIFQCAKLLANTDVIQFYPSKFVLITEILDTFGKLVFERIWEKSTYKPKGSSVAMQLPGKSVILLNFSFKSNVVAVNRCNIVTNLK